MVGITFVITSVLLLNVIAIIIPKKLTTIEIYTTIIFVLTLGLITDCILDLHYNFYSHFNSGPELLGFLAILGIYPSSNIIMLNYFPYHKPLKVKILYILMASGAYLFYEWLSLKSGYFHYTVWELWYSALCYPVLILIIAGNIVVIRKMIKEQ